MYMAKEKHIQIHQDSENIAFNSLFEILLEELLWGNKINKLHSPQ
jgi:hypothetical protein